jgi:hypothetical protein
MPVNDIHLITVDSASQTPAEFAKSEAAANDNTIVTPCCQAKRTAESTRYWNGIRLYKSRMRRVPVKRVFSPIA